MNSRNLSVLFRSKFLVKFVKRNFADCERIVIKCVPKPDPMSLTIIGATSKVGKISALLFKKQKVFKKMHLYDANSTEALASDLNTINKGPTPVKSFSGIKTLEAAITDSRIIYICGGIQTGPGLSSQDLFDKNSTWVRQIITYCAEFNPHACVVITTPPVSYLVPMAVEEYRKVDINMEKKVFGVTRTLVSRANSLIGERINVLPNKINSFVVGGCHRRNFIPIFSHIEAAGSLNPASKAALTDQIQDGEDVVLRQKMKESNGDGCYLSNAYNGVEFTTLLAKALTGTPKMVDCAFVKQMKPMDEYAKYFSCVVEMDREGVKSCHIPKMSNEEKDRLKKVMNEVRYNIFLGSSYITGDDMIVVRIPQKDNVEEVKKDVKKAETKDDKDEKIVCPPKRPPPKKLRIKVKN